MPNRFIKESICRSDEIDALSWFEEVLFYRLIVNCDDFGRFDARPKIVKNTCFPLKEIRTSDIVSALKKLTAVGLISVYEAQGKSVLQLTTWNKHQSVRAAKSKYPDPDLDNDLKTIENNCNQSQANAPVFVFDNRIRNSEFDIRNSDICTEPGEPASAPKNAVITLTLNDKSEYPIYQEQIDKWAELYPAVDVIQQLRGMKDWLNSNPTRRKTKNGILRFVSGWLSREQDKGGNSKQTAQTQKSSNPFLDMYREEVQNGSF